MERNRTYQSVIVNDGELFIPVNNQLYAIYDSRGLVARVRCVPDGDAVNCKFCAFYDQSCTFCNGIRCGCSTTGDAVHFKEI